MGQSRRVTAVIPYRVRNGRFEVAMITSANSGDWIVPKGGIEEGEQPWEAAAREAEEEAGLAGVVDPAPLGRCHPSSGNGGGMDVYVLRVTAVLDHWPEENIRRRRWASPVEAAACLRPEFRPFITAVEHLLLARTLRSDVGQGSTERATVRRSGDPARIRRRRSRRESPGIAQSLEP